MTNSTLNAIAANPLPGETNSCWSCGATFETTPAARFCELCGKVQPPVPADYFGFFGLPRKLNIDVPSLEKDFYALSRKLHPDLSARASSKEQQWSLEQSSLLNDAYRTLRDPVKRTQYLLKLEGIELEEQSKSATEQARVTGETKKQIVPPDLLEEVFELNMQLEEWRMHKKMGEDDPSLKDEIEKQKATLEAKHESLLKELQTHWNEWDALIDSAPESSAEQRSAVTNKMVDVLNRRNYIRNLVRDVNAALET
ncbi:MAG TPA: Fe-S protein assembly co-chaperone HscB [Candidatus Sulfotelmatobacter sp.]|jgi:molecular chaperone HscB|nr:Fe-S protein assembly co-chaperone HscB [Candidatus Sulfotelmatobacter sp.]